MPPRKTLKNFIYNTMKTILTYLVEIRQGANCRPCRSAASIEAAIGQKGKSSPVTTGRGDSSSDGRIPGVGTWGEIPLTIKALGTAGQTLKHPPHPIQYSASKTGTVKGEPSPRGTIRRAWVGQTSAQAPQDCRLVTTTQFARGKSDRAIRVLCFSSRRSGRSASVGQTCPHSVQLYWQYPRV